MKDSLESLSGFDVEDAQPEPVAFVGKKSKQCAGPCGRVKLSNQFEPEPPELAEWCKACRELMNPNVSLISVEEEQFEEFVEPPESEDDYGADLQERWQEDLDTALRGLTGED